MNKFIQYIAFITVMVAGIVGAQNRSFAQVDQVFAQGNSNPGNRIRICHSTDSHSNPYTNPEVDQDAVDGNLDNDNGQGDHYMIHNGPVWFPGIADHSWGDIIPPVPGVHNGKNWTTEGQAFWNNACNIPTAASPSPSPSVDPSPTPDPSADPSPTPPIGGPQPSPTPAEGRRSRMGYDASCNENFDVVMDLTDNGNPVKNVEVTFNYRGHDTKSTTNQDGRARVSYRKDGEGTITAKADNFPGADVYVTFRTDCPSTSGEVLGTSTHATHKAGKVLGATTLANTGTATEDSLLLVLGAGVVMMIVSARYYMSANHAQTQD